jgi:hypothetical protein
MSEQILIPFPGLGTLALNRARFYSEVSIQRSSEREFAASDITT